MKLNTVFHAIPVFTSFVDIETGERFRKTGACQAFHNETSDYVTVGMDREVTIEYEEGDVTPFGKMKTGFFFFSYGRLMQKTSETEAVLCSNGNVFTIKPEQALQRVILK